MKLPESILFTQCLQNDFVALLEKYDPLPNSLHVGYQESKRLLGEMTEYGPVHSLIEWAYSVPEDDLWIVHIRDWHDANDPLQKEHLRQFGNHCIKNTKGAEFVFQPWITGKESRHKIINASGLNDFVNTDLSRLLEPIEKRKIKVGITGVWTEAKIQFLAYDLRTRYPEWEIAACSALCASSSIGMHFIALDQMKEILGVVAFPSIGAFTSFLSGSVPNLEKRITHSRISTDHFRYKDGYRIAPTDEKLLLYLFRDCKDVEYACLDGGFSGNVVLKSKSTDHIGHNQVPCVIKIGPRDSIARERIAFERIEEVLGNNAPSIVDFAELEERGAIKYRYAAMLEGNVRTFQKTYATVEDTEILKSVLDTVFLRQLGKLYEAASREKINLLEYYDFHSKYAASVREKVEILIETKAEENLLEISPGFFVANVCKFYEQDLTSLREYTAISHYTSYVHGDLNGANIILDAQDNVWLIDFFHTHKGHILKDLIKLENDILYIFTKIESPEDWKEATELSDELLKIGDLGIPVPKISKRKWKNPDIGKAYEIVAHLRSYYPALLKTDRDPYQLHVAALRYAMHTLSFDESNEYQKKWALYSGSICVSSIRDYIRKSKALRIDYLKPDDRVPDLSKIGLTILPGRKDRERNLREDMKTILDEKITHVLCLLTENEFAEYGVKELKFEYESAGLQALYFPILDQAAPLAEQIEPVLYWMDQALFQGGKLLVHCVGGLGRSGTLAAAYAIWKGNLSFGEAVSIVRESRSERAIESKVQEEFLSGLEKKKITNK
ncbi:isochorismatase family protein [Leptospira gomenensis]|uniref:Isochorismatase family protein n=1 Tax=Leptospira gomenensis TaxID=2484974 RepID=A0A5F1YKI8_9LEPT|nr:dual specificity protein phosphatase family protein [Leptospira gomenensis]TGK33304.1 isochorismatase family protein [Leptospira gomenensis]TGK45103.1 isochorismatase family protein [Leptospira gomenensis]TGK50888.1 isochorismatase family protein [Leptospira gomenensis]TGK56511.1 isochorismatase family protein [Leptospira gomenensis]